MTYPIILEDEEIEVKIFESTKSLIQYRMKNWGSDKFEDSPIQHKDLINFSDALLAVKKWIYGDLVW